MTQMSLPSLIDVDINQVRRLPSMTKAISLCADLGGFENDKDFCRKLDLDQGVWTQIQAGARYFPQDKYTHLFDVCGNEVPLIWLADKRGYELVPLESEMEKRLRVEHEAREKAEAENRLLKGLLVGRAS